MEFSIFKWTRQEIVFVTCVLLSIFGVSYFQLKISQMKTRDAQRKSDVELVSRALNAYFEDYKILPAASAQGEIISCGFKASEVCPWGGGPIIDSVNVVYLKVLPVDPQVYKGLKYNYSVNSDRTKYKICITLEYRGDKDYKNNIECNWYAQN